MKKIFSNIKYYFRKILSTKNTSEINEKYWIIGIGGFGSRAVEFLQKQSPNTLMYAIDTKEVDLSMIKLKNKIIIGKDLLKGLGSEYKPNNAKKAVQISAENIKTILKQNSNKKLYIITGFGRGTGTGATPEIVKLANQYEVVPEILAISYMGWGDNKDNRGLVKECFIELEKILCNIYFYDDDFLRKKIGELKFKKAFVEICDMLKKRLDEIETNSI